MHVKFKVVYDDDTFLESHDEMYNVVSDHAYALAPHNTKKWKEYYLISDEGHEIYVNFNTGIFRFNGVEIQPQDDDGEVMTFDTTAQISETSDAWTINNGLPYFPVVGRRIYKGDLYGTPIDSVVYFAGWRRRKGDKTIKKIAYLWPNGKYTMN